jgi:xylulokinase
MLFLLGLDIGTSGAKALLCDERGTVRATAMAEYPLSTPQPLWNERTGQVGGEARRRPFKASSGHRTWMMRRSLGLTDQMHGAVSLDADDEIIRPALLWNDQRTRLRRSSHG